MTTLNESKNVLSVQVQAVQNENGMLLAEIETAKDIMKELAEKCDHHLVKVKELTRAKMDLRRDLDVQGKGGDAAEDFNDEVLIEAETVKDALQTQIDELKQTMATEVVEFATQTGDC